MKIWHGEDNIASWESYGGHKDHKDSERNDQLMFDDSLETYWHGHEPFTERNKVVIQFHQPINFYYLEFYARPDKIGKKDAYREVCLDLDDITKACTDDKLDPISGQKFILSNQKFYNSSAELVTEVELRLKGEEIAKIADLSIVYGDGEEVTTTTTTKPTTTTNPRCEWNFPDCISYTIESDIYDTGTVPK